MAEPRIAHLRMSPDSPENAPAAARKYDLVRAAYLAAIGVATLGWLWLITWIAFQFV